MSYCTFHKEVWQAAIARGASHQEGHAELKVAEPQDGSVEEPQSRQQLSSETSRRHCVENAGLEGRAFFFQRKLKKE